MAATGTGHRDRLLDGDEIGSICDRALDDPSFDGRRLLVLVPDLTRSCPLDAMFRHLYRRLAPRVARLDFMIALGTHPALSQDQIYSRFGIDGASHEADFPLARFFNHCWDDPAGLAQIGLLQKSEIAELTDGRFEINVEVTVNRMVYDYDLMLILGPVFPHEVVGFSGGNKYIFPGISGPDVLHFFHWLGAVITSPCVIGKKATAVRRVIDAAAARIPIERRAFCMVVRDRQLAGLYYGTPEEAWSDAADLSGALHVVTTDRAYDTVLSCAPAMYDEVWVAGKCMYKLEPTVADGGRLVIYAPHLSEVSTAHGKWIREVGYHTRDYFLGQWEQFRDTPWSILAHSSHVRGIGSFEGGEERCRIEVILATQIPESECRSLNLGYMDPRSIDPAAYRGREGEGVLCVDRAGEILYRWKDAPPELGGPA